MKLVFQIAAGIILAVVIMYGAMAAYSDYQLKQVAEVLKLQQLKVTQALASQQRTLKLQQARSEELRRQEQRTLKIQQARSEELRQQQQKTRSERVARQQKVNEAWTRYYKEPYNCQHPSSQKEFTWCGNYKADEKRKFLDLLAQGKIIVG